MFRHEAPVGSQVCHWKPNLRGMPPLKVPGSATSGCPTSALPVTVGFVLNAGGAAAETASVGFELTGHVVPPALLAVTSTMSACPTSTCASVYACFVAPAID